MVIVYMKSGFYEFIMCMRCHSASQAPPFDFHKIFSRSLPSCLTGPHTHLFLPPRFNAKAKSNDGELFDKEHGTVPRIAKTALMQSLITVVFGKFKCHAFFQKYFLQIEFDH